MTRSLQIVIEMDNAAFDEGGGLPEVRRILTDWLEDVGTDDGEFCAPAGQLALWDVNGNRVGYAEIIEEK